MPRSVRAISKIGGLDQAQQDVFDIFTDVPRLCEGGGIGDTEWHIEYPGKRLRQQRLAATGGADQQNVAFTQLNIIDLHTHANTLVVVVDRYSQRLLGALLSDHVLAKLLEDLAGSGYFARLQARLRDGGLLLLDDLSTQVDAFIANINTTGTCDKPLHLVLTLTAE